MKIFSYSVYCLTILAVIFLASCTEEKNENFAPAPETIAKVNTCEGCHTNYDHLKEVYTPDPPSDGGAGCGGDAPHYEPYDRVYMGGDGYESFKMGTHSEMGCVYCHNGTDGTADKDEAHSGDFLRHPSTESREKCGVCHVDIVNRTTNSLHEQGWGQKNMVVGRSGYGNHPTEFDNLPELMKSGYDTNCAKCHGTCGECHLVRPKAGGGGLLNGHNFNKTPHMRNNCTTCHVSRGGHAYFGEAIGTKPDVHLTELGFDCMSCHTMNEIHGDGNVYDTRYKMPLLPTCEKCHSDVQNSNMYHSMHMDTFSCYTCHSQDFNNCGSCHVHGEGARIPSHQKFKIGMNPIPDIKPYKMATLRQSLSAPDTWKEYGISDLANFTYAPTYKYTTPHNILKRTQRTEEMETAIDSSHPLCAQACHIIKDAEGNLVNEEYYLFESDLEDWEIEATKHITVDGKLPSSWDLE